MANMEKFNVCFNNYIKMFYDKLELMRMIA